MLTPVQSLISWVNEMQNSTASLTFTDNDFRMLKQMRERFEQELESEKKVISDAYLKGAEDFSDLALNDEDKKSGEEYYNETFKPWVKSTNSW